MANLKRSIILLKYNKDVKKIKSKGELPFKMDMSLQKINRLLKK